MSRCYRCDGCRDQWSEAEGEPCPHCGFPGGDTRGWLERFLDWCWGLAAAINIGDMWWDDDYDV